MSGVDQTKESLGAITAGQVSKGDYASQWWFGPRPGSFEASGFQGQKISVAPGHCLVGVRLSHAFGLDTRPGDGPATPQMTHRHARPRFTTAG